VALWTLIASKIILIQLSQLSLLFRTILWIATAQVGSITGDEARLVVDTVVDIVVDIVVDTVVDIVVDTVVDTVLTTGEMLVM
jgi:hypothetical protein